MKNANIRFSEVELKDGFWKLRQNLNAEIGVYSVKQRFEETGRFDAVFFRKNEECPPHVFFDSDVFKWAEGVSYLLEGNREKYSDLEKYIDEMIESVEKNRAKDGYFNSYYLTHPEIKRFSCRYDHELYCAGHMIEFAIAYDHATGKGKILRLAEDYINLIYEIFVVKGEAEFDTPGHEEIELALLKLYEYNGNAKALDLAKFFLEKRGVSQKDFAQLRDYDAPESSQSNAPLKDLSVADGHSVRAMYLYSAMADYARIAQDGDYAEACKRIFADACLKTYVTGGIGQTRTYEGFTVPYDLPNENSYSETCAEIAYIMFLRRMELLDESSVYADMIEKILFNSFLSSTSLDGDKYFYENPLELCKAEVGKERGLTERFRPFHPIAQRLKVFGCSCCPPNVNRMLPKLSGLILCERGDTLVVDQYISCVAKTALGNVEITTENTVGGKITLDFSKVTAKKVAFRIPKYKCEFSICGADGKAVKYSEQKGYAVIDASKEFSATVTVDCVPHFTFANPLVRADVGRVCLSYGPLVYCVEEIDNGANLNALKVSLRAKIKRSKNVTFGVPCWEVTGKREFFESKDLYADDVKSKPQKIKFIPYFAFANRGASDMLVWIRA